MSSKGTGYSLALGIVVAFIGYILWQITIGIDTKSDDITTILTNSGDGSAMIQTASILICVGMVVHLTGLISTRGTATGSMESIGILSIAAAIALWVANIGLGISLAEMGEKFTAAMAGAAAGNAEAAATASNRNCRRFCSSCKRSNFYYGSITSWNWMALHRFSLQRK